MNHPHVLTRTTSPSRIASPAVSMLECDYDVRPTILYKCIQTKSWPRCLQILNHPDHSAQASVWVVRKEPNGKLRWRLLPLHAALIFQAPFHVIEALLEAHPEAAAAKDDQGMLPLHLALRNRPVQWNTVEELLAAYPAAVYIQDRKGRTPLQGAASASNNNRVEDNNTTATNNTPDDNCDKDDNAAALSVLQLYTQIAVAGERKRLEPPVATVPEEGLKIQQRMERLHAESLKNLQALLQKEKQQWKRQLESMQKEMNAQASQSSAKETLLLKEIERLQQQSTVDAHPSPKSKTKTCSQCCATAAMAPNSPTIQDLRVLELEQENQILKDTVEQLYNQQNSLQQNMDALQEEQRQAHESQEALLQSLVHSVQQAHASRQAHIAIWKSQLQQANKAVTEKLAQVGLTSSSTDDDERTCLEQIEIDHDNSETEMSSVVVVRVPKVFFQSTSDAKSLIQASVAKSAGHEMHSSGSNAPQQLAEDEASRKEASVTLKVTSLDAATSSKRKARLAPPLPEGLLPLSAAGVQGASSLAR